MNGIIIHTLGEKWAIVHPGTNAVTEAKTR
jgi:hypothetical protein